MRSGAPARCTRQTFGEAHCGLGTERNSGSLTQFAVAGGGNKDRIHPSIRPSAHAPAPTQHHSLSAATTSPFLFLPRIPSSASFLHNSPPLGRRHSSFGPVAVRPIRCRPMGRVRVSWICLFFSTLYLMAFLDFVLTCFSSLCFCLRFWASVCIEHCAHPSAHYANEYSPPDAGWYGTALSQIFSWFSDMTVV